MGGLTPIAFDIETSGLDADAVITAAGLATDLGARLYLNTGGRPADHEHLLETLTHPRDGTIQLAIHASEADLLAALPSTADTLLDPDNHYLTAYNGETWNAGFDLPFLRTACVRTDTDWPFPDIAYADTMALMDRFDTHADDLVGVHRELCGGDAHDPFDDSEQAVSAYEAGRWQSLLQHNLADIERTRELALLADRYVPKSDFNMKNLEPPSPH